MSKVLAHVTGVRGLMGGKAISGVGSIDGIGPLLEPVPRPRQREFGGSVPQWSHTANSVSCIDYPQFLLLFSERNTFYDTYVKLASPSNVYAF
ncbi:hypothetical protein Hypma_014516 [Hypsizygus marmoreus]|uniref:Uncharacterized protein n=1 Tax=Hypsizygus marmoreus TaxID=39966 RepID=A0A369JEE0_HYPMA|nr:hypothetical protein Hypma_014516 [Hypsizygus marmoreus]